MDLGIAGRRALVAASSGGLGLGAARALREAGCQVVISGRDAARLSVAAESVPGAHQIVADLSTMDAATRLVEAANDAMGGVDILITNNGGPPAGNFASTELDAYQRALDLNLLSMIALCKAAVPAMQAARWGRVVAITSLSVRQPMASLILSNVARSGYTSFLKTLALEVVGDGVTVNSLQPGLHRTARVEQMYGDSVDDIEAGLPAGTMGDPDDFGRLAAFLCSESAKFVTGVAVPVDGGSFLGLQ